MVYRYRAVHRGDIIVFRRPEPPHDVLIKRVVGLPGDLLAVRSGHLYINGVQQHESFVDKVDGITEPTDPADPYASAQPDAPWSLTQPFRVPAGQYFVMGDNRTDSSDSRYWGTVPRGRSSAGPSSPTGRSAVSATSELPVSRAAAPTGGGAAALTVADAPRAAADVR